MCALKIEGNTVKSAIPYDYKLPEKLYRKNLAEIVFDEVDKHLEGRNDHRAIINARNPSESFRLSTELKPMSVALAKSLKKNGFKRGDVIQLLVQNNPDFFTPVFATWLCGGVASVVGPNFRPEALSELFASTNTSIVFCISGIVKNVLRGIQGLTQSPKRTIIVVVFDQMDAKSESWREDDCDLYRVVGWSEFLKEGQNEEVAPNERDFKPDDEVVVFWSSGTTGAPKGAIYHYDLLARMVTYEKSVFVDATIDQSTVLVTTNFFHAGSFTFNLVNGIKSCNTIVVFSSNEENSTITAHDLHKACHDYKVKLMKVGSHHATLLGYSIPADPDMDLSSLEYIMPMGAPVNQGLTEDIRKFFPNMKDLLINYGSTEMFLVARTTIPGELGLPYQGVEYKILSQESKETFVGPNEEGEIIAKTPYIMKGYLKEEQNKDFFRSDGFIHTGDLGYYKQDGTLVFKSRLKELIKYNGNHLYPLEIENIIKKHPGVAEVAVFGMPCPEVQELVTAIVIKNGDVTAQEIEQVVIDSGVESFKYIRGGVKFASHIPKNATGKILRMTLPDFYKSL